MAAPLHRSELLRLIDELSRDEHDPERRRMNVPHGSDVARALAEHDRGVDEDAAGEALDSLDSMRIVHAKTDEELEIGRRMVAAEERKAAAIEKALSEVGELWAIVKPLVEISVAQELEHGGG